ncbi:MAG TPA: DUF2188 domain-containing protein [Pseudolysinimonas sp.]|nr:DUF2188 domain-containing protein [Pseudolysinimonas sp.]
MLQIHVVPTAGQWTVSAPERESSFWGSEWDAVRFARYIGERAGSAEIHVFGPDGLLRTERVG